MLISTFPSHSSLCDVGRLPPHPIQPGGAVNHREHPALNLISYIMKRGGHMALAGPLWPPHPPAYSDQPESFQEFSKLEVRAVFSLGLKAIWLWTQHCWLPSSEMHGGSQAAVRKGQSPRKAEASRHPRCPQCLAWCPVHNKADLCRVLCPGTVLNVLLTLFHLILLTTFWERYH